MDQSNPILELEEKYHEHYPDPNRPVHSKIIEAYVNRLKRFLEVIPTVGSLDQWQRVLPDLSELISALGELRSYAGENPLFVPMSPDQLGEFLISQGLSFAQAQEAVRSAGKRLRGRPITVRPLAVRALEIKRLEGQSWMQIAKRLCECGADRHTHDCEQRIRQAVLGLQRMLKRYHVTLSGSATV